MVPDELIPLIIQDTKRHLLDLVSDFNDLMELLTPDEQNRLREQFTSILDVPQTHELWDSAKFEGQLAYELLKMLSAYQPIKDYLNIQIDYYAHIDTSNSTARLSDKSFKLAYQQAAETEQQLEMNRKIKNAHYYRVLKKIAQVQK